MMGKPTSLLPDDKDVACFAAYDCADLNPIYIQRICYLTLCSTCHWFFVCQQQQQSSPALNAQVVQMTPSRLILIFCLYHKVNQEHKALQCTLIVVLQSLPGPAPASQRASKRMDQTMTTGTYQHTRSKVQWTILSSVNGGNFMERIVGTNK